MSMRYYFLLALVLLVNLRGFGQLQKITHQTFTVSDSITLLTIDVYGDYTYELWPSDRVMLEMDIRLYNASEGVMNFFMEAGRYEVNAENEGPALRLVSKDKERRAIRTSKGECFEEVKMHFFIPEDFASSGEHQWSRPSPLKKEQPKGDGNR